MCIEVEQLFKTFNNNLKWFDKPSNAFLLIHRVSWHSVMWFPRITSFVIALLKTLMILVIRVWNNSVIHEDQWNVIHLIIYHVKCFRGVKTEIVTILNVYKLVSYPRGFPWCDLYTILSHNFLEFPGNQPCLLHNVWSISSLRKTAQKTNTWKSCVWCWSWDYKLFLALLKEKATHQYIIPAIINNYFEVTCGSLNVRSIFHMKFHKSNFANKAYICVSS